MRLSSDAAEHESRSPLNEGESHSPSVGACNSCRYTRIQVKGHWVMQWEGCDQRAAQKQPATDEELASLARTWSRSSSRRSGAAAGLRN